MSAPGSHCPLRQTALWPQVGAFLTLEPFCQLILLHADKGTGEFNIRYFFFSFIWGGDSFLKCISWIMAKSTSWSAVFRRPGHDVNKPNLGCSEESSLAAEEK